MYVQKNVDKKMAATQQEIRMMDHVGTFFGGGSSLVNSVRTTLILLLARISG